MESFGTIVKERREALGLSQEDLAAAANTSQGTIDKIENNRSLRSRFLPAVFTALNLPLDLLTKSTVTEVQFKNQATTQAHQPTFTKSELVGDVDLPIFAAARGGLVEDSMLLTSEPIDHVKRPSPLATVRGAYGVYVIGDSMSPVYEQGDLVLVNPHLPARPGDDVILCSSDGDGSHYAIVKRLIKSTPDEWLLRQFNPPAGQSNEFALYKDEWPISHLVVGSYKRR